MSTVTSASEARKPMVRRSIDRDWVFAQVGKEDTEEFLPVAQFPTNVHLDLMELKVQWVGEESWIYKTVFSAAPGEGGKSVLVFEGLDTYASVTLNGHHVLDTDNMFVSYRADVSKYIQNRNELEITFDSAFLVGRKLAAESSHKFICFNGDSSRLAVRKAQYHYGWDWGPTLLTCGPWKPIYLETYSSCIRDLSFRVDANVEERMASIECIADVEGEAMEVDFIINDPHGKQVAQVTGRVEEGLAFARTQIYDAVFWYPRGYGAQPLYTLHAKLTTQTQSLDEQEKRFGIRRAQVVQRELEHEPGMTFFFEINNIPLFCGGSNWIPADSFLPRIDAKRYRDWLQLLADGNQIMTRVWGGGIFEADVFYDICDELGILVWQDFMFACGSSPVDKEFLKRVEEDSVANLKRLRHHPSIVLYAGNNEDYQVQEQSGLEYNPVDKIPENWLKSTWPARYIYEKLLNDICHKYVPDVYYHYGSPFGGKDSTDPTVGDVHEWNVWHGAQHPYQRYDILGGRFVSEFGMEGFPCLETIRSYLDGDHSQEYPQSAVVDFHNKADGHERRIATYLVENFKYSFDMEEYIYVTQLVQAEALATAYRVWRRRWQGPGRELCAGVLVWQLNDCWPVTSWALADYYLRPKLAYYSVKRSLAQLTTGIERRVTRTPDDEYTKAHFTEETHILVWVSNLGLQKVQGTLRLRTYDLASGELLDEKKQVIDIAANCATEILQDKIYESEKPLVIQSSLVVDGHVVARYADWPQPFKYLDLPKPTLEIQISEDQITLSSNRPVKGLAFTSDDAGEEYSDNCVDIMPDDPQTIHGKFKGTPKHRFYGM